jgi:hypothetical protein
MVKVQGPHVRGGCFTKDRFVIDLAAAVVTCPNNVTVALRPLNDGGGHASFGRACSSCPLRTRCTTAKDGRVISVSVHEALLQPATRTAHVATICRHLSLRSMGQGDEEQLGRFLEAKWLRLAA